MQTSPDVNLWDNEKYRDTALMLAMSHGMYVTEMVSTFTPGKIVFYYATDGGKWHSVHRCAIAYCLDHNLPIG